MLGRWIGSSWPTVPSARRGNAWLLETGDLDLALGAVVDHSSAIRRMDLCTEGFACAARVDHPGIKGKLDLAAYVRIPHLVVTLGDDAGPTWIDQALAKLGTKRRIAVRIRYFMAAPLVISQSDLLLAGPSMLIHYFARIVPLQVLVPPIDLRTYPEEAYWHEGFEDDPAHAWLRNLVKTTSHRSE